MGLLAAGLAFGARSGLAADDAATAVPAARAVPAAAAPGTGSDAPAGSASGSALTTASASLDISSQVDRSEITIGDRIQYEIKVVYPNGGRVELPSVLGNLGSFEVKEYQASEPKDAGKLKIQTWHFDLSTFTVGKYTIPPQQILFRRGADTSAAVYFTQPIEINVVRTSPETVKDIADIATLAEVPSPPPWLAIGLGAAVLMALAFFLWRKFRRKTAATAVKPALPPFEEAMAAIAGLKDLALIRQNRAREFCFALSEALRRYISRRYGIDALESTTSEFIEKVRTLPVTGAQKQWLAKSSEEADLVKFANALLLESEAAAMLASVEEFLKQTRPKEDEQAGNTGSGAPTAPAKRPLTGKPAPGGTAGTPQNRPSVNPTSKPGVRPPAKPKGPGPGPGYTQGGHGHDPDNNGKGWTA
ncbi:MAG: hypothetical protein JWP91_725 [Fibrobacteres bacterium]|nr:hypothetical protein [Fibrobacterota bacterium]